MRKIRLILAAMLVLISFGMSAQQSNSGKYAQIKGRVVEDVPNGEPVGFATIYILPQDVYTATDIDGNFEFKNVEPGKKHTCNYTT